MAGGFVIAIDGPVASGKGTIAPLLAAKYHGFYLQTGAMYRAVALYCLEHHIDLSDKEAVSKALVSMDIHFVDTAIYVQGKDVTLDLHDERVSKGSSQVAVIQNVREFLVPLQQKLAKEQQKHGKMVVAEGRDTATRVFPHADLAIFLTARSDVRAKRRQQQILERTGEKPAFETVLKDVEARDRQDSTREVDPLVTEPEKKGYSVVDTSDLTEEETLKAIEQLLKEKGLV